MGGNSTIKSMLISQGLQGMGKRPWYAPGLSLVILLLYTVFTGPYIVLTISPQARPPKRTAVTVGLVYSKMHSQGVGHGTNSRLPDKSLSVQKHVAHGETIHPVIVLWWTFFP